MQWSLNSNAVQQTEFEHEAVTTTRENISFFSKDHTEFAYYVKVEFDLFIQGGWTWKPISIEVT